MIRLFDSGLEGGLRLVDPVWECESLKAQAAKTHNSYIYLCILKYYLYEIMILSVKITAWTSKDYVFNFN